MLLIPLFLSPEQQGYWYLFISLGALSIFADLGFSNIILQFSAHEYAFLRFAKNGLLEGEGTNLKKLGSFFRFTIKWISMISIIVFPIVYTIGILFFVRDQVLNIYFLPWTLYAIGSFISFLNNSILSFVEGLDKIAIVQKIRFRVAVLYSIILASILILGGNIYALAFGLVFSASSIFISIFGSFGKLLKQLLDVSRGFVYSWKKEVVPLFIKYALSFSSGFFVFQIYTPLMHYFHGPVYSGKVGITMALVTAISSTCGIWLYTIVPKVNILISQKLWSNLDKLFMKRLLLTIGTYVFISLAFFVFVYIFASFWVFPRVISRFLPILSIITLFICFFFQQFITAWALYLRGHKQEPYVVLSIISALWVVITTFLVGMYLPPTLFFMGFLASYLLGTPFFYIIYRKKKMLWHEK